MTFDDYILIGQRFKVSWNEEYHVHEQYLISTWNKMVRIYSKRAIVNRQSEHDFIDILFRAKEFIEEVSGVWSFSVEKKRNQVLPHQKIDLFASEKKLDQITLKYFPRNT
jgi:hypothetical protein